MNSTNIKRDRLISAASELFHKRGLNSTSLADIAAKAEIPIGNVYYYFKTKEELAVCALEKRMELMEKAYHSIEEMIDDPRERLRELVLIFEKIKSEYAKHGCPVGRIISESEDMEHRVSKAAIDIFDRFVEWTSKQFEQLGHVDDAKRHATSIMSAIQGATILAKSRRSEAPLTEELYRILGWIDELPNKKIHLGKVAVS